MVMVIIELILREDVAQLQLEHRTACCPLRLHVGGQSRVQRLTVQQDENIGSMIWCGGQGVSPVRAGGAGRGRGRPGRRAC